MNLRPLQILTFASAAIMAVGLFTGCHTTSIKSAWKSPDYKGGPVQKVALVAVADEGLVRGGFENRLAKELAKQGQAALATYQTLGLQEIKANKEAAAAKLRQAGADSILILRLVDISTQFAEVRQSREAFVPVTTGVYYNGWYDGFSVGFTDMSVIRGSTSQDVRIGVSLFDLNTGKQLWACTTDTVVKDDVDRLKLADAFVAKVVVALRKDGMVR
jgi:hypothetical protein